jgi:hypothetical protein
VFSQIVFASEELVAVSAFYYLGVISFLWEFYEIFISSESFSLYLVFFLGVAQFSIVSLDFVSDILGLLIGVFVLHI